MKRSSANDGRCCRMCGIVVAVLLAVSSTASAGEFDKYVWEVPRCSDMDRAATAPMVEILNKEIQKVLDAGPLAPLRTAYADIPYEAYFSYFERGRMITTVAWAYPHVGERQQAAIRKYVQALLKDPEQSSWTAGILRRDQGAERSLSGVRVSEGRYFSYNPKTAPTAHVLYGLWLYGDRTGDWETIRNAWPQIKQGYARCVAQEVFLYGQMGAHIGVARLAKRFGDEKAQAEALAALEKDLRAGAQTATIEERQKKTRFGRFYEKRSAEYFTGQPWKFLDACPEILRFVADHAKGEALERVDAIEGRFPLWWVAQSPYFTRWTGDEGVGAPPDLMGICFPMERWVRGAPPETLAKYLRSMPTGVGDCYWIEALVQGIEGFGRVTWRG